MDRLIHAGYNYMGNAMADDIPHWWVTACASRRAILTLCYYCHFDDQFFLMSPAPGNGSNLERPGALCRNWKAQPDAQVGSDGQSGFGRCFTLVLRPRSERLGPAPRAAGYAAGARAAGAAGVERDRARVRALLQ